MQACSATSRHLRCKLDIQVGSVLVGESAILGCEGVTRVVTGITTTGSTVVVDTETADLDDIFVSLRFSTPSSGNRKLLALGLDFGDVSDLFPKNDELSLGATAKVSFPSKFQCRGDIIMEYADEEIKELHLQLKGAMSYGVQLEVSAPTAVFGPSSLFKAPKPVLIKFWVPVQLVRVPFTLSMSAELIGTLTVAAPEAAFKYGITFSADFGGRVDKASPSAPVTTSGLLTASASPTKELTSGCKIDADLDMRLLLPVNLAVGHPPLDSPLVSLDMTLKYAGLLKFQPAQVGSFTCTAYML